MLNPDLTTTITRAHDCRSPSMKAGFFQEGINSIWPQTELTKWITTREHDSALNTISDSCLFILSPDDALIATGCEISKRILIGIVLNELSNGLNIFITHFWQRCNSSEEQIERNDDGEYSECSETKFNGIRDPLAHKLHGTRYANHSF